MKRISFSLGAITFVAALAIAATGAFFSDTETSAANTFTAGAIDLTVDSTAHYAGLICTANGWADDPADATPTTRPDLLGDPCSGTWEMTDLGPTNQFFNLGDLKPGDPGENTISLHVSNNDAYVCAIVNNLQDNDNGLTEPESEAGDVTPGPIGDGELSSQLHFFAWADNGGGEGGVAGDNIWNGSEVALFSNEEGPASDVLGGKSYPLFVPQSSALSAGSTTYVGLYWCYGAITVGPHTLSCNGSTVDNITQTDSMTADISFYTEQARNNPNFTCPSPEITPDNTVTVNQNDLATLLSDVVNDPTKWFFYNDTNPEGIMTIDQFSGLSGQNHMESVAGEAGAKMVLDTGVDPRYNIATAQFGGTLLNAISSLKFRVYDATADSDTPFIQFNVDFATSTVAAGYEGRLTMQPGSSTNAPLAPATWTTVDAINGGNAMWTWSKFALGPDLTASTADDNKWPDGNTNQYRTWNSIITSIPTAKLLTPGTFFGVRDGQPGPAGATDVVSSIEFNGTVYNFEL